MYSGIESIYRETIYMCVYIFFLYIYFLYFYTLHIYYIFYIYTYTHIIDAQVKMAQKDNMTLYISNNSKKLYIVNSHLQWLCSVKLSQTLN